MIVFIRTKIKIITQFKIDGNYTRETLRFDIDNRK